MVTPMEKLHSSPANVFLAGEPASAPVALALHATGVELKAAIKPRRCEEDTGGYLNISRCIGDVVQYIVIYDMI